LTTRKWSIHLDLEPLPCTDVAGNPPLVLVVVLDV
jgi:hypothetical protein